ncbi:MULTISPECIES: carbohydrate kinase family protein [Xanthomonas]|uniref:carbohydrate kinase family protein n=1 Tax=Xanthomonas TaxID=338 RepID=UPI00226999CD|nr:PfkB family carbohydrate kinase [Xanthomonas cucurbitae]
MGTCAGPAPLRHQARCRRRDVHRRHRRTPHRRIAATPVQVRDTTGAGDAFDAGFIAAWRHGQPLDACVQQACRAGAACCSALGALDGLFLLSPPTEDVS